MKSYSIRVTFFIFSFCHITCCLYPQPTSNNPKEYPVTMSFDIAQKIWKVIPFLVLVLKQVTFQTDARHVFIFYHWWNFHLYVFPIFLFWTTISLMTYILLQEIICEDYVSLKPSVIIWLAASKTAKDDSLPLLPTCELDFVSCF